MSEPLRAPIPMNSDDAINKMVLPVLRVLQADIDSLRADNARLRKLLLEHVAMDTLNADPDWLALANETDTTV